MNSSGTVYGFEVHSSVPLAYLRDGGGGDELRVDVARERPVPEEVELDFGDPGRLHRAGDGYALWVEELGWYDVDPATPAIAVPEDGDGLRREERLWGVPALLCFRERGDLPVHGGAVEVGGEAILLCAPGHHGKTTLSAAFCAAGYRLLSEDMSCVRLGEPPTVLPGPALLRMRTALTLDVPGETLGVRAGRLHIALAGEARGNGAPVPLRGIVLVNGFSDEFSLARVAPEEATRSLWALTFRFANDADRARSFMEVADLAATVPVWELTRPYGFEWLMDTVEAIAAMSRRLDGGDPGAEVPA